MKAQLWQNALDCIWVLLTVVFYFHLLNKFSCKQTTVLYWYCDVQYGMVFLSFAKLWCPVFYYELTFNLGVIVFISKLLLVHLAVAQVRCTVMIMRHRNLADMQMFSLMEGQDIFHHDVFNMLCGQLHMMLHHPQSALCVVHRPTICPPLHPSLAF